MTGICPEQYTKPVGIQSTNRKRHCSETVTNYGSLEMCISSSSPHRLFTSDCKYRSLTRLPTILSTVATVITARHVLSTTSNHIPGRSGHRWKFAFAFTWKHGCSVLAPTNLCIRNSFQSDTLYCNTESPQQLQRIIQMKL